MADYITSLQYVTPDDLDLLGADEINYHVRVNKYADDEYFEDTVNGKERLNTIVFDRFSFAGADIKSLKLHYEVGLLTDALAIDTMTADVTSTTAVTVARNTPITVKRGEKVMGVFYNGQIKKTGLNQYQIYAESALSLLDYDYHNGGVYTGLTTGELLPDLMGSVPYTVNTDVAAIRLYGYLPRATRRENLQQVILATGAAIRKGEDNKINITILPNTVTGTFSTARAFEAGDVSTDTPVTAIQVTEHTYLTSSDAITLYEDTFVDSRLITFSEPAHSLTCTGGTIVESSANHAVVQGSGAVKLTGKKYTHTTKIITRGTVTGDPDEKIYSVTDATLVGPMNSSSVANRLYKYVQCNQTVTQDVLVDTERPGDLVQVIDPHGTDYLAAAVQAFDYTLSNTMRAAGTFLLNYVPDGITSGYKNRVVLTASGAWTVPGGVTNIRVVLIGGGQGGAAGDRGGTGERGDTNLSINEFMKSSSRKAGGAGGAGGTGGSGGNVLDVTLDCNPGHQFLVAIGAGGTGGTDGSGSVGGNTTFGDASSASGVVGAYTDMQTGDIYAQSGESGKEGGRGGGKTDDGATNGGDVTLGDGVWWEHGEMGSYSAVLIKENNYGCYGQYSMGECGWGGGAAAGANGGNGGNGHGSSTYRYGGNGGNGGSGATATIPGTNATVPGSGGHGGHGGGGGGAGGSAGGPIAGQSWAGSGGAGGAGSSGGSGAPGCVIIYY